MSLLDTLVKNQDVIRQMAGSLGLGERETASAMEQMMPALTRGIQRNTHQQGGLDALLGALAKGNHGRYLDRPADLGNTDATLDGNAILGHILGSKDVSRNVAGRAARETGLDSGLLKKMLPMLASAAMAALSKQSAGGQAGGQAFGARGAAGAREPGLADALGTFLDADRDGSIADDLLNLAQKFF